MWHRGRRTTHSLKGRLLLLFLLLALATTAVFLLGMQRLLHNGWESYARPLVSDYTDRLAEELGAPPDLARAQALVRRLPITLRITGPLVQFDSHPWRNGVRQDEDGDTAVRGWGLSRRTADGHRIRFGLASPPDAARPRLVGWATLAALLLLTGIAYATVRRLLAPVPPGRWARFAARRGPAPGVRFPAGW